MTSKVLQSFIHLVSERERAESLAAMQRWTTAQVSNVLVADDLVQHTTLNIELRNKFLPTYLPTEMVDMIQNRQDSSCLSPTVT